MATKHLVPRGDGEGGIGNSSRSWGEGHFKNLHCSRSLAMPVTDTAGRPSNPATGTAVFDTDVGGLVIWNGVQWVESGVPSPKTLLVTVDPAGAGTVTGGGTYDKNTDVAISATANTNYSFLEWQGDVTEVRDVNENPTLVKMTQSWSIVAKFSVAQYDLTVEASPSEGGTVTGGGTYDYGSVIDITANPDTANGYLFSGWTGDGITDSSSSTTTVLVDGNKTVTANFALDTYDLTINTVIDSDADDVYEVDTSGTIGTTTGSATSIAHGSVVNITATVTDSSYEFKGWEGTGVTNPNSPTTTVTVTSDLILNAKFGKKTYTIDSSVADFIYSPTNNLYYTLLTGDGSVYTFSGDASGSNPNLNATTGDTLTFTNNTGGHPLGIYNSSNTLVASESSGVTTFTPNSADTYYYQCTVSGHENMRGDIVVTDGAAETPGSLTVGTQNATRSGTGPYLHSDTVYLQASVDSSYSSKYEFSHWSGDTSVLDNPNNSAAIISSITSNVTLVAHFKLKQYTLTVDSNLNSLNSDAITHFDTNLSVSGTITVDYGSTGLPVSYVFAAGSDNYLFDGWTNASDVADSSSISTNLAVEVTSDLTITANFSLKNIVAWFIIHDLGSTGGAWQLDGSGSVGPETSGGGATAANTTYDWDLNINGTDYIDGSGQITTTITGTTIDQYSNGTVNLGGTTVDAFSIAVDAFTPLDITTDFSSSQYGFVSLNGHGTSSIFDSNNPNTDITLIGNSLFSIQVGKKPNANFTYENKTSDDGNVYFGDTLTFYDVSTAPAAEGIISSSVFSAVDNATSNPVSFYDSDTGIRVFREHKNNSRNKPLTFNNPGRYGDPTQEWTIFIEAEDTGANQQTIFLSRGTLTLGLNNFLGNGSANNWYFRNVTTNLGQSIGGATTYGGRMIIKCDPSSSSVITIKYRQETGAIATRANSTNQGTGPATTGPLVIGGAAQDNSEFTHISEIGYHGWGALYKSIGLLPRLSTSAEEEEFLGVDSDSPYTELTSLSYLNVFDDYYNLGSSSQASITGENSGNFDLTFAGEQTQFVSIGSVDIPSGSSGETSGSFDVTLTVTDDQALTTTNTQTINYILPILDSPSVADAQISLYEDSTKSTSILQAPIVIGAVASYNISGEQEISVSTTSASGSELTNYTTITGLTSANTYSATAGGSSSLTSTFDQNYYSS